MVQWVKNLIGTYPSLSSPVSCTDTGIRTHTAQKSARHDTDTSSYSPQWQKWRILSSCRTGGWPQSHPPGSPSCRSPHCSGSRSSSSSRFAIGRSGGSVKISTCCATGASWGPTSPSTVLWIMGTCIWVRYLVPCGPSITNLFTMYSLSV